MQGNQHNQTNEPSTHGRNKKQEISHTLSIYKGTVNKYVVRTEADTKTIEEFISLDNPVLERSLSSGKLGTPDGLFEKLLKRLDITWKSYPNRRVYPIYFTFC